MKNINFAISNNYSDIQKRGRVRSEERRRVIQPVYVTFYNAGQLYRCTMVDLSRGGACLLLRTSINKLTPKLPILKSMECYITTNTGQSKCRGCVRWQHHDEDVLTWGISFIEVSTLESDALRILVEETFWADAEVTKAPVNRMAIY